jgi:hypothetical protein
MINKSLCKSIPKNSKKIFGSGGSKTVIVITPDKKVYKYFMVFSHYDLDDKWIKKQITNFRREINIQKILTKNIVNKNLSPHIATLDASLFCKSAPHFLFNKCHSFKKLLKTPKKKMKLSQECKYLVEGYPVKIEKGFLIANIEYCPLTLGEVILKLMRKSNKTLENNLNRLLFQLIYTLAIIGKKYPYFVHHDFFIRNILATENKGGKNDYFRYHFGKYVFDVPAYGYITKITDFGETNLDKKNQETPKLVKSPYEDVFNIIYDIYNGGNHGAESCISIARKRKNEKKEKFLHKYFSKFINTKFIQEIEKNKRKKSLMKWNWRMLYDPEMSKLFKVKLPKEYLKHFIKIYPKNDNHHIVEEFGK